MRSSLCVAMVFLVACGETEVEPPPPPPPSIAVLGAGAHTIDAVSVEMLADGSDGLSTPTDLAFDPSEPTNLYLVNRNSSVVIVRNPGTPSQVAELFSSPGGTHFLAHPSSLAFGDPGFFATAQEEDEVTQPSTPTDFMGPSLWTTDASIFDAGHGSHMDMLHNSPNGAGIAWDRGNAYWVFDGAHAALTHYDFNSDHGPGGADHSDGVVRRYVEGQVAYRPRVPSHMEMVGDLLYVADTGNNRIAVLDPTGAEASGPISPNYDGTFQNNMSGGTLTTLVDGRTIESMLAPSGLAIDGDIIYLGDNETARVWGFNLTTGMLIDYLDLDSRIEAGGLMGIEVDSEGRLLVVDGLADRLFRISPLPPVEPTP